MSDFLFDGTITLNTHAMEKIQLDNKLIQYTLVKTPKSRSLRLAISVSGTLTVKVPTRADNGLIERFIRSKSTWILKHLTRIEKNPKTILSHDTKGDYIRYKDSALLLANKRLEHFNQLYNTHWKSVTIRNQKTRWGSCSKNGSLNFSYKIILLDPELCDYIIVHELCHLLEFNHSPKFWKLVERAVPNYLELRTRIKQII